MSDNWIRIIPKDPLFVPSQQAIEEAELFMERVAPAAEDIRSEVTLTIQLRDCGANMERILCPVCGTEVSTEWWQEQMGDEDYWDQGIQLHPLTTPCGHALSSLNDLRYDWDQGYSLFVLDAMNPGVGDLGIAELDNEQREEFERILGCELKVIYQHI